MFSVSLRIQEPSLGRGRDVLILSSVPASSDAALRNGTLNFGSTFKDVHRQRANDLMLTYILIYYNFQS